MTPRHFTLLLLVAAPCSLAAQSTLSGKLVEHATGRPMYCHKIVLLDSAGAPRDSTVTWRGGTFEFAVPADAPFQLRIASPGPSPLLTAPERAELATHFSRLYRIPWIEHAAVEPDTVRPHPQRRFRQRRGNGPEYPPELRDAGISGYAHFTYAIDTLGRIDAESALPTRVTHEPFARAVDVALARMRFHAWRPDGGEHCALIQQRFDFKLTR